MERVSPNSNLVAGDWMNRFEQLADNPQLAQATPIVTRPRQSEQQMPLIQKVAYVAAGLFAVGGFFVGRRSLYLIAAVCGVIGLALPHLISNRQNARNLLSRVNFDLDGIEDNLQALADYKIQQCVSAFDGVQVSTRIQDPSDSLSTHLKNWSETLYNGGEHVGSRIGEISFHVLFKDDQPEVQNYRRILPTARRFVALDLQTMPSLQHIQNAAFRFVNGYEKNPLEKEKRDYINCTLEGNTIKAEPWNDSPDVF